LKSGTGFESTPVKG